MTSTADRARPPGGRVDRALVTEFFAGHPLGEQVFDRVWPVLDPWPDCTVRVSRSQVAFRRRRGLAWLWLPGQYLNRPAAELVLSVGLGRRDPSPRWKEVAHPASAHWIHHLEIRQASDVDDEVDGWLREAAERAG